MGKYDELIIGGWEEKNRIQHLGNVLIFFYKKGDIVIFDYTLDKILFEYNDDIAFPPGGP